MEKRYIVAAALTFLVLILWQVYFAPKPPPPAQQGDAPIETARPVETGEDFRTAPDEDQPVATESDPMPDANAVEAAEVEEITVETDLHRVVLTNRGGRVVSWTLRGHNARDGEPLQVVSEFEDSGGRLPLGIVLADRTLEKAANQALYQVEQRSLRAEDGRGPGTRVRFEWADRGLEVVKELEFRDGDYIVEADVEVIDRGRRIPVSLTWGPGFQTRHGANGGLASYYYANQVAWDIGGSVARAPGVWPFKRDIGNGIAESGRLRWAGIEDQYFTALIVPPEGEGEIRAWPVEVIPAAARAEKIGDEPESAAEPVEPETRPMVAVSVGDQGVLLYVGPKNYSVLTDLGHDLGKAVWFSSIRLFAFMARFLYQVLNWVHANVVPNYGVAIIITTVMLRIALFPLNQFSMVRIKKSQAEMQKVQPKINAIKAKYRKKKDAESRAQMNQEVMALYKKEGINPMGGMMGCMPMLAQFPILLGFYDMLVSAIELRGAPFFGWITDLTLKDPYYVTPLLMGATMFIQQRMTATKLGDPAQQRIMMMTPVIFTVMFINLPSGLVLYWFVNNLLGIGQQWLVNRHVGRMESAKQRA